MEPTNQIDRLTLELLTSRKQYRQYLKHTDTQKYLEQTGFIQKVGKYKSAATSIIHDLLADPEKPITNEITDTFIPFMQAIFHHLESANAEYNDTLFDDCEGDVGGLGDPAHKSAYSKRMVQYSMQMFIKPKARFMEKPRKRRGSETDNNLGVENNILGEYRDTHAQTITEDA
jgi:hypothetical protein